MVCTCVNCGKPCHIEAPHECQTKDVKRWHKTKAYKKAMEAL